MEGYIGGGLLTVILGVAFTQFCVMYGYPSLICPAEANNNFLSNLLSRNKTETAYQPFLHTPECKIPDVFLSQPYKVKFLNHKWGNIMIVYTIYIIRDTIIPFELVMDQFRV